MSDPFLTLDADTGAVTVTGDWHLRNYAAIRQRLDTMPQAPEHPGRLDLQSLGQLDTAGASLLAQWLGADALRRLVDQDAALPDARRALLLTVADATSQPFQPPAPPPNAVLRLLEDIGKAASDIGRHTVGLLAFGGLVLQTLAGLLLRPRRWRMTALVAQIEQTGLNAVPIVMLLTFMVGAVVAFLGATVLRDFGASLYTVDLVAFSFLREFGILLSAILLAGRTGSAFTAQIGSMKANQELDAIQAQGLNPIELVVIPRVLALLVALPILTFLAMLSGILGGMVVCALSLDIPPAMFLSMLQADVVPRHFILGIAKAPIFAFLIAIIGCREGFLVSGSAQSVGEHTTSSVVQAIFVVILLDAIAALFYMEMGW